MTLGYISVEVTQWSRETRRCAGNEGSGWVGGHHGYHLALLPLRSRPGDWQEKKSYGWSRLQLAPGPADPAT